MNMSYDYTVLMKEIKEDIQAGLLLPSDIIQILRSSKSVDNGYKPIIDWYYNHNSMLENFNCTPLDNELDIEEKQRIKKLYEKDAPFLESISVSSCLSEMEKFNKII